MVAAAKASRLPGFGLPIWILLAAGLGLVTDQLPAAAHNGAAGLAKLVLGLFLNALSLVSLPVIFLALSTTLAGMESVGQLKRLGRAVVGYTLGTTLVAAAVALALLLLLHPAGDVPVAVTGPAPEAAPDYWTHLGGLMPRNVFQPFIEGNVFAVLILAVVFGLALLQVPNRSLVHQLGSVCLAALMQIVGCVRYALAPVVWAGVTLSMPELRQGDVGGELMRYFACVVLANLVQGLVVLPLLLRLHGIAPWRAMGHFAPALSMAFFSKSSVATIPVAIDCAENKLGVHPQVARFTFPICTTINMNGCAAFILTTVLYVGMAHGRVFSPLEMVAWIGFATLAAVGNAGVPMGCYFLASAILAAMGLPLTKMTLILPFYSLIDMLETALNVWSDGCVAMLVNRRYRAEAENPA